MDRKRILSRLNKSWRSLEQRFKKNSILSKSKFDGTSKQPYDQKSHIRALGAEPYFQAALYSELSKLFPDDEDFVLGVEGKKTFDKRPDIWAWNPYDKERKPYFIIELKVTGFNLLERNRIHKEGHFLEDVRLYSKNDLLRNGQAVLFYGCYYECDPDEIKSKIRKYGSILRWVNKTKGKSFPKPFSKSIVEGYAFTGANEWDFIDNADF